LTKFKYNQILFKKFATGFYRQPSYLLGERASLGSIKKLARDKHPWTLCHGITYNVLNKVKVFVHAKFLVLSNIGMSCNSLPEFVR